MERVILKWSCSRHKFGQVIAANTLKEVLGRVSSTTWELEIKYDDRETNACYPTLNFYLNRDTINGEGINVTYKIISDSKVLEDDNLFFHPGKNNDYVTSYVTKELCNYRLDLYFIFENNSARNTTVEEEFQIVKLQNLSTHFQDMFEKEHMTDVILKCESITLKAHKSVLSIQSPVFEAMFASPMLESKLDMVVIKDIDPTVFRAMVSFMYSGQVKVESETMAYDLLYAAEKYQIEALKEGCIEYLKSLLSPENAIKILEISCLFDRQLKLHCLSYIKNQFQELKYTKDWKDLKLKNPVLAIEVYSCVEND